MKICSAGFGAEAWGEYLRLSANYYQPADWQTHLGDLRTANGARGYDINAQKCAAVLPQHINTSVSLEQYLAIA